MKVVVVLDRRGDEYKAPFLFPRTLQIMYRGFLYSDISGISPKDVTAFLILQRVDVIGPLSEILIFCYSYAHEVTIHSKFQS